jgi:2-C-methyl-D-erythritol 4-phosphate cytidylyltransferase/2-C-methyl-D-erythritol 2,4-cyclodiphosphate synthase
MPSVKWAAIIVAAGRGARHGGEPKQFRTLNGAPVVRWSADSLFSAGAAEVIVAVDPAHRVLSETALAGTGAKVVSGGATRTASVKSALANVGACDILLVHDAARPGLRAAVVTRLLEAIGAGAQAVAPVMRVADALAGVEGEPIPRDGLVHVQTPQAFLAETLRNAYQRLSSDTGFADDLAVVRAAGSPVSFVEGDPRLMKITFPGDLEMVARLMGDRVVCVGNGVDAHRFGPGEYVTLCGVRIPHDRGLVGHSDADAGWHALVDALLGAVGEGDIGAHFPPGDPHWKGADSATFLRHAAQLVRSSRARIMHVDISVMCERPRLGPHREAMRSRTAEVIDIPLDFVSVKATTTEKMGFLGREEGLAAFATASVERFRAD